MEQPGQLQFTIPKHWAFVWVSPNSVDCMCDGQPCKPLQRNMFIDTCKSLRRRITSCCTYFSDLVNKEVTECLNVNGRVGRNAAAAKQLVNRHPSFRWVYSIDFNLLRPERAAFPLTELTRNATLDIPCCFCCFSSSSFHSCWNSKRDRRSINNSSRITTGSSIGALMSAWKTFGSYTFVVKPWMRRARAANRLSKRY